MGNFYTTVQILDNAKLGSKKFTEKFCKKMADEGYVSCGGDEAEQSYILHFAENSSWVAVASEEYTPDGQKARADALRFAKLLKAPCVNTNVIDSDCAVMDVYGATGKKLDTLIMGRADDYFGDNYPDPSEKPWGMFLADGTTWERFMEVRNGDYTFVEDGLAELAPLIGMDSCNIGFTAEEAAENDDTVFLYFKNARSGITMTRDGKVVEAKSKAKTLKDVFTQVFLEELAPLGFIKVKSRYPYLARLVGEDIVQIIALNEEKVYREFYISTRIITIYKSDLGFNISTKLNSNNFLTLDYLYKCENPYNFNDEFFSRLRDDFEFNESDVASMKSTMEKAFKDFKLVAMPIFNLTRNLYDYISYLNYFCGGHSQLRNPDELLNGTGYTGAFFFYMLSEPITYVEHTKDYNMDYYNEKSRHTDDEQELKEIKERIKKEKSNYEIAKKQVTEIINNKEYYDRIKLKLTEIKNKNYDVLRKYGFNVQINY